MNKYEVGRRGEWEVWIGAALGLEGWGWGVGTEQKEGVIGKQDQYPSSLG